MEIIFIGHACFKIKGKNITIVTDPYDPEKMGYKLPKLETNVLLVTHDHFDHGYIEGVSKYDILINTPGEFETNETFIFGYETFHDEVKGEKRGKNTIYLVDIDGFNILHVGDLGHELSKETLERMPDIAVLLIPVGGTYTIDAKTAIKVISSLEPGIVIPMHYATPDLAFAKDLDTIDKFLNEMGVEKDVRKEEKLVLKSKSDIPQETEVVLLKPQH